MTDFPADKFWDFSISVYKAEGVPPVCLDLQSRYGADVNVLLYSLWHGAAGRGRLKLADFDTLESLVGDWHEQVVRRLRALRVELRPGLPPAPDDLVQSLRRRIQKIEIDAEHIEQLVLSDWAARRTARATAAETRLADAAANAKAYLAWLGASKGAPDWAALGAIFAAVAGALELPAHAAADLTA